MDESLPPGPADVDYFTLAQAGSWGDMLKAFARFVGPIEGQRTLDVGAGPGLLSRLWAERGAGLAVACDDSWPMLVRAADLSRGLGTVALFGAEAARLPVASGAFDVVTATNLLFLLANPAAGLAELVRVAHSGGLVAFLNPGDRMSREEARAFADSRGLEGFARDSFINYGRLAEGGRRLSEPGWQELAGSAGLQEVRGETRAGGLVVLVSGRRA